jgi:hypothetical protein
MHRTNRTLPRHATVVSTLAATLVAGIVAGCTGSSPTASAPTDPTGPTVRPLPGRALFAPFEGCDDLLSHLKAVATRNVGPYGLGPGGPMILAGARGDAESAPVAAAPSGTSTTNTQEQGVDEGDQVETDGRMVYTVVDGRLRVVDTVARAEIARVDLPPGDHQLLLDGTRLVVVTNGWGGGGVRPMPAGAARALPDVVGGDAGTTVAVYDVSAPASPTRQSVVTLEGRLVAARSAKGVVRLVLHSSLGDRLPFEMPNKPGTDAERKATEANRKAIADSRLEDWLPRSITEAAGGAAAPLKQALSCKDIGRPAVESGLGLTWLASLPLGATTPTVVGSAGVVATGDIAYLGGDNLYVATTVLPEVPADADTRPVRQEPARTAVHTFGLGTGTAATYLASGAVPGTLLNSYAMSEHDGVLRVATTVEADGFGSASSSGVYTLRRNGDDLVQLGAVTGLGRTERIYAVRYLGPVGYVVTFRQTDPLYVIDLRDPAAPKAVGELKIPGFSSYLHPLGDGRLLGIGQDATSDGQVLGTAASLFDVSDPSAPKRLANLRLAQRWSQSEAEYDPHAFLWWSPAGRLVVPVSGDDGKGNYRSSAVVVTVGASSLTLAGSVEHPAAAATAVDGSSGSAVPGGAPVREMTTQMRRSLVVGGRLVTVSPAGVKVNDLASLAEVAWIPFGA